MKKTKTAGIKQLKKIQKWAENEIAEYEELIYQIKEELRGRRKKCPGQQKTQIKKTAEAK